MNIITTTPLIDYLSTNQHRKYWSLYSHPDPFGFYYYPKNNITPNNINNINKNIQRVIHTDLDVKSNEYSPGKPWVPSPRNSPRGSPYNSPRNTPGQSPSSSPQISPRKK